MQRLHVPYLALFAALKLSRSLLFSFYLFMLSSLGCYTISKSVGRVLKIIPGSCVQGRDNA
jgi:hypothetical protein